jgi:hypothetical protein
MMITVDAPISFLLGSGLVLAVSQKDNIDIKETFYKGLILQTCVLSPVIIFFMLRFPDWEWNYLFDAQAFFFGEGRSRVGATSLALILALLNLTYIIGFKLGESLLEQQKTKALKIIIAATVSGILLTMLAMLEQTLHVGTLAEFENKTAGLIFFNIDFLIAQTGAGMLLGIGFFLVLKSPGKKTKP